MRLAATIKRFVSGNLALAGWCGLFETIKDRFLRWFTLPMEHLFFSAGKEGVVRRVDSGSDEMLGQWKCHDEPIYSMDVSPDGLTLATGDWSGKIKLWNVSATNLVLKSVQP